MNRDIDLVIAAVAGKYPGTTVEQLTVSHPADDDGIWYFRRAGFGLEVNVESSAGMLPFLVESNGTDQANHASTIEEAVQLVGSHLKFGDFRE